VNAGLGNAVVVVLVAVPSFSSLSGGLGSEVPLVSWCPGLRVGGVRAASTSSDGVSALVTAATATTGATTSWSSRTGISNGFGTAAARCFPGSNALVGNSSMSNKLSVTVCAQRVLRRWYSLCEKSRETHETRRGQSSRAKAPPPPPATTTSKVNANERQDLRSIGVRIHTRAHPPTPPLAAHAAHRLARPNMHHAPTHSAHSRARDARVTRDARAMRHRAVAFRAVSRHPRRRQCAPSARRASRIRAIRASKRSKRVVPECDARARAHEHRAWRRVTGLNAMPRIVGVRVRQGIRRSIRNRYARTHRPPRSCASRRTTKG